jgi:hypothetical protein
MKHSGRVGNVVRSGTVMKRSGKLNFKERWTVGNFHVVRSEAFAKSCSCFKIERNTNEKAIKNAVQFRVRANALLNTLLIGCWINFKYILELGFCRKYI